MSEINLRIEQPDGTLFRLPADSYNEHSAYDEQWKVDLTVPRFEWVAIQDRIDDINDEFYIEKGDSDIFGGRLADYDTQGPDTHLQIGNWETDSRDAKPTDGDESWLNVTDIEVIQDAISQVPTLQEGTLDQLKSSLSFRFPHSSQAKKMRKVLPASGGEIRYNPDQTVDYLDRLGEERSEVISPENRNIVESFKVTEHTVDKVTHLKGLGHGMGDYQLQVTEVSDAYDGGKEVWRKYKNKEITEVQEMEAVLEERINEYEDQEFTEVSTTIEGLDVSLGDTFRVVSERYGFDKSLRVVELNRIIDSDGERFDCLLSSRRLTRGDHASKQRQDVERFNEAYQGVATVLSASGGRQMVDDGLPWEESFFYPSDVKDVLSLQIEVTGLAYRGYTLGAAAAGGEHSHEVTLSIDDHTHSVDVDDHSHSVSIGSHTHTVDFMAPYHEHEIEGDSSATTSFDDGHDHEYFAAIKATDVTSAIEETETTSSGGSTTETTSSGGGFFETTSGGGGFTSSETTTDEAGVHDHEPQPGILESFDIYNEDGEVTETNVTFYPSNCDVVINNTSMGVSLGDGEGTFQEVIEVDPDLLSPGFNTIQVTTDTLGSVNATLGADLFRQMTGGD